MENKWEILEVIDEIIGLDSKESFNWNKTSSVDDWFEKLTIMNNELKRRNLIGEFQCIYFVRDQGGKIENINLQTETRNIKDPTEERFTSSDGNDVIVYRRNYDEIQKEKESTFKFDADEWTNYRRTKLMDRMLNEDR